MIDKKENENVFCNFARERLLSLAMNSGVAKYNEESIYIGDIIYRFIRVEDPIPRITEHHGEEFIGRGFIGLGFFKERVEYLTKFYGYPSWNFYAGRLIKELREENKKDVAQNTYDWLEWMRGIFQSSLKKDIQEFKRAVSFERIREHQSYGI